MDKFNMLQQIGQSLWYDNIRRSLLEKGELKALIDQGEIRGVTSNPTIFNKAISSSTDYNESLKTLAWAGLQSEDIFYQLAIEDIQTACDLFNPVYKSSNGLDGYVSLEVNPKLAYETEKTFYEVKDLWERVKRGNLMVKIPATKAGIPAIRLAIAEGINVNVTLIFSLSRYEEVMDAYICGLEDRVRKGLPINNIASVASFFVSRIDTKVDKHLEELIKTNSKDAEILTHLMGKAAIASARLAYQSFERTFSSERFRKLHSKGAKYQRPLWASTSTKNPAYPDTLYVDELIAKDTVNTVPPQTLDAFRDHGSVSETIYKDINTAQHVFSNLEKVGISMQEVTQALEDEGVKSFAKSFTDLLDTIETRRKSAISGLGSLQKKVIDNINNLEEQSIIERIFDKDPSVWSSESEDYDEIKHRLGWLDAPQSGFQLINEIDELRNELLESGYTHGIVLGMGGSSLAPEVFSITFNKQKQPGLSISILDSTDPQHIKAVSEELSIEKTLFIVSSKSGTTSEVHAYLEYFWKIANDFFGSDTDNHFIAITDPNTPLQDLAIKRNFRKVFLADPNVGGRYSALTAFGLVPAGLMGIDLNSLLSQSNKFAQKFKPDKPVVQNPGAVLGCIIASAVSSGRDKLTILADGDYISFGSWLEQLIAESSGKQNKGIIPIDIEPQTELDNYGNDRIFVYFRNNGDLDERIVELQEKGHPTLVFDINNEYDMGAEFYRWEFATAIACSLLGINAFDQPDVQDNKRRTVNKLNDYEKSGYLTEEEPLWQNKQASIRGNFKFNKPSGDKISEIFESFLNQREDGDYIAINAYLPRNPDYLSDLQKLRRKILDYTHCATSLGFGPRFLHSTGQLHKGGPNKCLIIQITRDLDEDIDIPGKGYSFGTLIKSQAIGDYEALVSRNRRIIQINLKTSTKFSAIF